MWKHSGTQKTVIKEGMLKIGFIVFVFAFYHWVSKIVKLEFHWQRFRLPRFCYCDIPGSRFKEALTLLISTSTLQNPRKKEKNSFLQTVPFASHLLNLPIQKSVKGHCILHQCPFSQLIWAFEKSRLCWIWSPTATEKRDKSDLFFSSSSVFQKLVIFLHLVPSRAACVCVCVGMFEDILSCNYMYRKVLTVHTSTFLNLKRVSSVTSTPSVNILGF